MFYVAHELRKACKRLGIPPKPNHTTGGELENKIYHVLRLVERMDGVHIISHEEECVSSKARLLADTIFLEMELLASDPTTRIFWPQERSRSFRRIDALERRV